MNEDEIEQAGELSMQNPDLFQEFVMKRSVDFKDPNQSKKPNTQLWNSINNIPKEKMQIYVRPKILLRDKEACNRIIERLEEEKVTEAINKQWYVQDRLETRARLMRQKEKNIKAEEKAGIKKDYLPVGMSLADPAIMQATSAQGVRLSMATSAHRESNSAHPISRNKEAITSDCINLQSKQQTTTQSPDH